MALIITDGHISTIIAYFGTWASIIDAAITKAGTAITNAFAGVAIAGITEWTTVLDDAKTKRDAIFSDSEMANKVDAYEDDTLPSYQREVARFAGGMADINAVNSSAYMVGLSLLARRRVQDVNKFRADLRVEYEKESMNFIQNIATLRGDIERGEANIHGNLLGLHARIQKEFIENTSDLAGEIDFRKADTERRLRDSFEDRKVTFITKSLVSMIEMLLNQTKLRVMATNAGITEMMRYQLTTVDMSRALASLIAEFNRLKIVASQEYLDRTLDLDVKNTLWDMNIYQYGTNVLSGIGAGGQIMPEKMSASQSALGGALGGAALGIQSGGGPAAIAAGAILGGIGGYLAGA
jgi:phosphotransferase system HPr-like phosphotransfer protein